MEVAKTDNDSDGDDDLLPDKDTKWKEAECLGEEFSAQSSQRSKVHIDLNRCRQMMARKEEIERACAPGRHKEAETQMEKYPEFL